MTPGARPPGPGLAKAGEPPLLRRRVVELIAATEGRLRALLDAADVVSEGGEQVEGAERVYYGSTSLLITLPPLDRAPDQLVRLLELDPHIRLRAVRVARREACVRAGGPLGPLHAELTFRLAPAMTRTANADPRPAMSATASATLALTVDVTAPVLRGAVRPSRA